MKLQLIRDNVNTNKIYKVGEFKEYIQNLNSDKVVIYHNNEPGIYSISKIKHLLINIGFYDNNHFNFQFKIEKGNLIITK